MNTAAQPLQTTRTAPPVALETVMSDDGRFHDIPTLDLGGYLAGDPASRDELAAQLRYIQENIGFYYVVNHGIDRGPVDAAYAALEEFCALPMEEKLKVKINENSVGYIPPESTVYVTSVINENTEKDLNETITLARERAPDHPHIQAGYRFCGPNPWPESLPRFKTAMVDYQNEMSKLGYAMLPLYALALDKPADFFDPYFTEPTWWTRNAHYPPAKAKENQFGIAPHCDHSFMTLLPISDVPGLEILTPEREWMTAKPIKDSIIVNTGEFLNRWTNGRFMPTPHRVVPPRKDRYSMAMFFNPSPETVADPLDTCISDGNPARFEPMTMLEYMSWYIDTNYKRDAGGTQS